MDRAQHRVSTDGQSDCHRRGPMHPEHAWWAWALALPKQFVPSGYRTTLPYLRLAPLAGLSWGFEPSS